MIVKALTIMKKTYSRLLFFISLSLIFQIPSYAQENSKISPDLQLQYFKDSNEQSILKATLTFSKNRMAIPVGGIKVTFYTDAKEKSKLTDITTNSDGQASLVLTGINNISRNEDYLWAFSANSEGNDTLEAGESSVLVRDLKLEMDTLMVDSVRTIALKAVKTVRGGVVPAEGAMVTVYVPRMFSLLPVGEVTLDATGSGSVGFPADIPGDREGKITVIAKIEDDPDFGSIEKREILKWGIPPAVAAHTGHRALWTKTPPTWMIVTLTILLSGVWGHYLYTVISLIRIKRESKKKGNDKKVEQFIKSA